MFKTLGRYTISKRHYEMDNTVLDTIYIAKINFHYIDGSSFLLLSSCSMTIHESCFVPYSDFDMLIFAIRKILLIVLISALLNPLSAITPRMAFSHVIAKRLENFITIGQNLQFFFIFARFWSK